VSELSDDETEVAVRVIAARNARERLSRDGSGSREAIQRRVMAFAKERKLAPVDYAKLMHKRIMTPAAMAFCEKHCVSMEWLLCGDLKALQKMTREPVKSPASIEIAYKTLLESFGKLDRAGQVAIVSYLQTQI
jgi:hypothetical protein